MSGRWHVVVTHMDSRGLRRRRVNPEPARLAGAGRLALAAIHDEMGHMRRGGHVAGLNLHPGGILLWWADDPAARLVTIRVERAA